MYKLDAHDYNIYYKNTFVKGTLPDEEEIIPIYVSDFYMGERKDIIANAIAYVDNDTRTRIKLPVKNIDFSLFDRGCINLSSSVFVLNEKSPSTGEFRHRKTLSTGNVDIIDPFKNERLLLHSIPLQLDTKVVLEAIINNTFSSAQEALENVLTFKRLGQAFHPDYFFGLKYKPNSIMIFRRDRMIGRVTEAGSVILKPKVHVLYEELSEFGLDVKKVQR